MVCSILILIKYNLILSQTNNHKYIRRHTFIIPPIKLWKKRLNDCIKIPVTIQFTGAIQYMIMITIIISQNIYTYYAN